MLGFVHETQAELTDWQVKVLYPIDSLDGHWRESVANELESMDVTAAKFLSANMRVVLAMLDVR